MMHVGDYGGRKRETCRVIAVAIHLSLSLSLPLAAERNKGNMLGGGEKVFFPARSQEPGRWRVLSLRRRRRLQSPPAAAKWKDHVGRNPPGCHHSRGGVGASEREEEERTSAEASGELKGRRTGRQRMAEREKTGKWDFSS